MRNASSEIDVCNNSQARVTSDTLLETIAHTQREAKGSQQASCEWTARQLTSARFTVVRQTVTGVALAANATVVVKALVLTSTVSHLTRVVVVKASCTYTRRVENKSVMTSEKRMYKHVRAVILVDSC